MASVEVCNMGRYSRKSEELRSINSMGCGARKHHHLKIGNLLFQNQNRHFYRKKMVETISEIDKCKSQNKASVSEVSSLLSVYLTYHNIIVKINVIFV